MEDIDNELLWQQMDEKVHAIVGDDIRGLFIETIKPCIQSASDALFWAECLCTDQLTHGDEGRVVVCKAGHEFYQAATEAVEEHGDDYSYFIAYIKEKTGADGNDLYMPLRIALTGVLHGPDLDKVLKLVGPVQARVRFEQVMDLCHSH